MADPLESNELPEPPVARDDHQVGSTPTPTILAVDDSPQNLALLSRLLKPRHRVKVANTGERALRLIDDGHAIDLILLDVMLPGMDGYAVCRQLKARASTRDIPVIFLTALADSSDETHGLEVGAVDYITKPISPPILLARVATHLNVKRMQDLLRDRNHSLEDQVRRRAAQAVAAQDVTIHALASLAETRDLETGNHIRRTQHYVRLLADALKTHPRFAAYLGQPGIVDLLFKCAPLHDIGKVGIPDHILLKPGRYTPAEFDVMKQHPTLGREAIERAEHDLDVALPFLQIAKDIVYCHHEKWDGSGYPRGLAGDAIPIPGRLMALADVYDALISRRVYKAGLPHAAAAAIIVEGADAHFDPAVVEVFETLQGDFERVAQVYADSDVEIEKKMAQIRRLHAAGARQLLLDAIRQQQTCVDALIGHGGSTPAALRPDDVPNHHACAFGQWYDSEGRTRFGGFASFQAIDSEHRRAHALARRLVEAERAGRATERERVGIELRQTHARIARLLHELDADAQASA